MAIDYTLTLLRGKERECRNRCQGLTCTALQLEWMGCYIVEFSKAISSTLCMKIEEEIVTIDLQKFSLE